MPNVKTQPGVRVASRKSEYGTPPVHYVYHWDRIFGALAVFLVVIGGIGYAGYRWLSPTAEPVVAQTVGESAVAAQPSIQPLQRHGEPATEAQLPMVPGRGELQSAKSSPSTGEVSETGAPAISAVPGAVARLSGDAPEAVPASEPTAEVAHDEPAASQAAQTDSQPVQASQKPPHRAMFRLQDTSVLSPAVERFQLAKSVINNEPRGDIESIVPKADGAAAIYCFSDVVGMKDKVLYYHWLRDGKRVAKVRVGAWGKRWRSHSSKILNPTMKGDWRVELRRADNTLLASAEFVYR
jgi:hypothetical protein